MRDRARARTPAPARRGDLLVLAQLRGLAVEEVAEPEPERELQLAAAAPDSTVSERRRTIYSGVVRAACSRQWPIGRESISVA